MNVEISLRHFNFGQVWSFYAAFCFIFSFGVYNLRSKLSTQNRERERIRERQIWNCDMPVDAVTDVDKVPKGNWFMCGLRSGQAWGNRRRWETKQSLKRLWHSGDGHSTAGINEPLCSKPHWDFWGLSMSIWHHVAGCFFCCAMDNICSALHAKRMESKTWEGCRRPAAGHRQTAQVRQDVLSG